MKYQKPFAEWNVDVIRLLFLASSQQDRIDTILKLRPSHRQTLLTELGYRNTRLEMCVHVCMFRLCFVDGSKCARKTLRCRLVLDAAQRINGSEIVDLFLNNADLEILCQICVVGNTH